jgi:acetyltransferase-like isoleucine patch superfamily enzyme
MGIGIPNKKIRQLIVPLRIKIFKKINDYLLESQKYTTINKLKSCGQNCKFYFPLHIECPGGLEVGSDSTIGTYVHMWCHGKIKIGDRVMIGSHTAITSVTHDYTQENIRFAKTIFQKVVIEDDVWIGTHSIILPGVTIGKGAVIGANSIVTKNVEPFSIVFGNPAKHYKYREVKLCPSI